MTLQKLRGILATLTCCLFAGVFSTGGCVIQIDDPGNTNTNDDNGGGGGVPTTVTINIVNDTGATIDPEIYITGNAVTDPAQLFAGDRKFTRFGVGNRGLLGNFDSDSFPLECGTTRVIGTRGGIFGDDLETPDGVGQQRILSQDVSFTCGDTIEFRFSRSGDQFSTSVSVTR